MYHYNECGLDNVYLENGYTVEYEDGEEFVSFDDFEGIHRAIAKAICEQSSWLSREQFKFLRKEMKTKKHHRKRNGLHQFFNDICSLRHSGCCSKVYSESGMILENGN